LQENIDKLKKEDQQLTSRIQRLNHEELEILRLVEGQRRSKQQEQDILHNQDIRYKTKRVLNAFFPRIAFLMD
jgi:hypothetical protein